MSGLAGRLQRLLSRPDSLLPSPPMDRPLPNSYWVVPGRLLAGEYPIGLDDSDGRARLQRLEQLRKAGIDTFIDLTEEGESPRYHHVLPTRSRHLRFAITDSAIPNNVVQVQQVLSEIRGALDLGRKIYVHCRQGIGRTGLIIGCYLAEANGDGKAALKQLNGLWQQSARSQSWPKVPQTAEQAAYIQRWPKLSKRTG